MYVGRAVPRAAAGLGAQPAGTSSQRAPETGGFVYCRNTGSRPRSGTGPCVTPTVPATGARAPMALTALSGDEQRILFTQLWNVLEPRLAVYLSSVSNGLRVLTQALLPQLRADHEAAAALCRKVGLRSCKELREVKRVTWQYKGLTLTNLATLATLGSVLPTLESFGLFATYPGISGGPNGVQRLAEGLGAGALPALTNLQIFIMHEGASALSAALGRGALPRLKTLVLVSTAIGDAALVALAPALRRLPALGLLSLQDSLFGDEGLAALVAPPPPAGSPPPPAGALPPSAGVLTKLTVLDLSDTQVTDAGCATLAAALNSGALPALKKLLLHGIPASAAAIATVYEARANLKDEESESESEEDEVQVEDDDEEEEGEEDGEGS